MKDSSTQLIGQPPMDPFVRAQIEQLCDFMQMLRACWDQFQDTMRQLDHAAAVKAHDLIVEGVMVARQVARSLGIALPAVERLGWELSPQPLRETGSADL